MNLIEYEKIGPEILQSCKTEQKMASLLMQNLKSRECSFRFCIYKKHTSLATSMSQLTFIHILYSLYIVCMYNKHTEAISVS